VVRSRPGFTSPPSLAGDRAFFGGSGGFGCSELFFSRIRFAAGVFIFFFVMLCVSFWFFMVLCCVSSFFVCIVLRRFGVVRFQICGFGVVCTVFYFCLCSRFLFFP
jgi:hypothetical protein